MEKEQKKTLTGPDKLTYNHSASIKAGEEFLQALLEEGLCEKLTKDDIKEWVTQAKKKEGLGVIEYLVEKKEEKLERVMGWATRITEAPLVDTDYVITSKIPHYVIDGLPMTLLSTSDFGAFTIVHCQPFLENHLDVTLLEDLYGALKINFALTTPSNFLNHIQRIYTSGRAKNRILRRADEDVEPNFELYIQMLKALELLPLDIEKDTPTPREKIIEMLGDKKPKPNSLGETEWWALTQTHPFLRLATVGSDGKIINKYLPTEIQKEKMIIPICEFSNYLTIATTRGFSKATEKRELATLLPTSAKISIVLASRSIIDDIVTKNYSVSINPGDQATRVTPVTTPDVDQGEVINLAEVAEDKENPTVIKLVKSILINAVDKKATDIHIAAQSERTWIRYRIDGNMVEADFHVKPELWKSIISRLKILSNIDIKFSPTPQDGKFPMTVGGSEFDVRVNTCPTIYGEKAVLRVQKKEATVPTLEGLGFYAHEKSIIQNVIDSDHGLLIICGPTGSGKSCSYGTPVIKYDGKVVPIETLKVGDLLMGPDSNPRKVLNTNPGHGRMITVTPKNKEWLVWKCNDVHILSLAFNPPLIVSDTDTLSVQNNQKLDHWKTHFQKEKIIKIDGYETIDINIEDFISLPKEIKDQLLLFKTKEEIQTSSFELSETDDGDYYGILLDGDGRFLLGDFTVTHNTTTLSAAMYSIDRKRWNVITAENPVEIRIPNVEQTPIDGIHMTFGKFVPAALRQDPDYIMIGETRDKETTEEVIRAAITGHVVMTTLHTNSAAGAPGRLIDMGAQPFLITDAVKAVCAQRLIRRLCANCARPSKKVPTPEELEKQQINPEWFGNPEYVSEPVGCKLCNNTGYRGRIAIIEGYSNSHAIREIIMHKNADSSLIRKEIEEQGGKTLYQHAVEHASRGTTSFQEALTVKTLDG